MSGNEAAWRLPEDMGAAELLRKLAGDLLLGDAALYDYLGYGHEGFWGAEKGGVSICRALESLADMVERELLLVELCGLLGIPPIGLIYVSKQERYYDLLPEEDRKAIEWVRENGGIEECDRKVEASMEVGDKYTLLRMELGKLLGYDLTNQLDASDEELVEKVGKLLMPDGMVWPRFDDGEPVRFGDVVSDGYETGRVYYVTFDTVNPVIIGFTDETPDQDPGTWLEVSVNDGERVKRPAPKVLDADGVEIRIDDEVWCRVCGGPLPVTRIDPDGCVYTGGNYAHTGDDLTHSAPVLAADAKPLREGETVYKVGGDGAAYIFDGMSDYVDGLAMIHPAGNPIVGTGLRVEMLTHERPDSWESLEEDADKNPFDYCKDVGHRLDTCENSEAYKARDLVRRAKKLAGVER